MSLRFDDKGEFLVVFLAAQRLDAEAFDAIQQDLFELCDRAAANRQTMVLDFGAVADASSSAIGRIVLLNKRLVKVRVGLQIRSLPPSVRELFRVSRLDQVFTIRDEERDRSEATAREGNKYSKSARIVHRYYRRLVSRIADEVLERASDFEKLSLGRANPFYDEQRADEFFEEQARPLYAVGVVYQNLMRSAPSEPVVQRAKEFDVTGTSIETTIDAWLRENPGVVVVSLSCQELSGRQTCVVVYREGGSCT